MEKLLKCIVDELDKRKGHDIQVLDFRNENPLCDYFVIVDAPSMRQLNALADDVITAIEKAGYPIKSAKRSDTSTWILIDAVDVVVHLFLSEERERYNLEKLYQDYLNENSL